MQQYLVTGMSCAACSARVEKAVAKVDGVTACSVSLLTNSMGVSGNASPDDIMKAVEDAGYHASIKSAERENKGQRENELGVEKEIKILKRRLISSLIFLVVLMYFSMGYMMWNFPIPEKLQKNVIAIGLIQLLLTIVIMVINQKFFINGFKSLWNKAPSMDTLVALGSSAAMVYSTYALFAMTDAQLQQNDTLVRSYLHEFYFESSAMILTLITVGKLLEAKAKGKTTNAIKGLLDLSPKTATILKNETQTVVPVDEVMVGDVFVVKPGESIPVDGIVIEGESAVNESALTGESIPVDKVIDSKVSAATINQSGFLVCKALRVGKDTTLSQIIQMVSDASATKAPIAKIADKVSGVFVPIVIGIAVLTFIVWLMTGQEFGYALSRGIAVLVISCPCALGLATPVAIMVGNGVGAKNGIMFKTAAAMEETGKVDIIALDKTGTITNGTPMITDMIPVGNVTREELLQFAYSIECKSEHPLAKAITQKAREEHIVEKEVIEFQIFAGNGVTGKIEGESVFGGNYSFIQDKCEITAKVKGMAESLAKQGKTPIYFAKGKELLGVIAVADTIKKDAVKAVEVLKNMGIYCIMLTGDHEATAQAIAKSAGVDEVIANVLPDGKENVVRLLQNYGKVAMVGDGINDAPALTRADTGIAIGAGTDVAIDAADIVLMKEDLCDVGAAIELSRKTLVNIKENLFWAFIYNIVGIPLAAGVWIPIFGWELNPMFGAAAMSLSSFCVVSNALRLNFVSIYDGKKRKHKKQTLSEEDMKKIKQELEKEKKSGMKKVMTIEGMMCGHCEARVKKALEALEQVESCVANHETNTAEVVLRADISDELLKKAVEEQDYKVTNIE